MPFLNERQAPAFLCKDSSGSSSLQLAIVECLSGAIDYDKHSLAFMEPIIYLCHMRNRMHVPFSENAEFLVLICIK